MFESDGTYLTKWTNLSWGKYFEQIDIPDGNDI